MAAFVMQYNITLREAFDGSLWVEARIAGDPARRVGTCRIQPDRDLMQAIEHAEALVRTDRSGYPLRHAQA